LVGIITDDSDTFLFGHRLAVYKNVFNSKKYIEKYSMRALESGMTFTREKMIVLAMLLGCDYTVGIKGIGLVNGVELLGQFGQDFEGLLKFREYWLEIQADPEARVEKGMKKFQKMARRIVLPESFPDRAVYDAYMRPSVKQVAVGDFEWLSPDFESMRDFCEDKLNWGKQKFDSMPFDLIRRYVRPVD
jgi:DNA excision repair protein ERCC-5